MHVGAAFSLIGKLLDPVTRLIDEVHTSDEERLDAKRKVLAIQGELFTGLMAYEKELAGARADIIKAEAQGQSWLQRSWRPITMLTFLFLVVCDAFGWLPFRLAGDAWTLLQLGLTGYVVGRSVEKVAPQLLARAKDKE